MCNMGDLKSAYGHALFNKIEVVNKRKVKGIPSNTSLNGSESRVSDPNDRGPRFITHWDNILLLPVFFLSSYSKGSDANIANFVCL